MTEPLVKVLIADDQALVRSGFALMLDAQPDLHVVGDVADGRAAVEAAAQLRPDLVLMDVRMPGLDGIAATREIIAASGPSAPKVLIMTTFDLDEHMYDAMQAGASGFLLKDISPADLVHGIRSVMSGEALLAPVIVGRLLERYLSRPAASTGAAQLAALTSREREVLVELAHGRTNAEIGAVLYLSPATVKTHVARILAKLGVRDRVHAVIAAYETGLIERGR